MSRRAYVLAVLLGFLLAAIALASCDSRAVLEVCLPLDSIVADSTKVVFWKTPCR